MALGDAATLSPVGKLSVKWMPLKVSVLAEGFVTTRVNVLVPPSKIVVGLNDLVITGACKTVKVALAVPVHEPPFDVVTFVIVFVYTPPAAVVTVATTVQESPMMDPPESARVFDELVQLTVPPH